VAQIEQPDRFEVRAEKRSRGPEHVVRVRPLAIARGVFAQHARRERRMRGLTAHYIQRGGMHRSFGGPKLRAHGPPVVVLAPLVGAIASWAPMVMRLRGIEVEEDRMRRTATAVARESRFLRGDGQRRVEPRREVVRETVREGREGRIGRRRVGAREATSLGGVEGEQGDRVRGSQHAATVTGLESFNDRRGASSARP
jgi:hypothetical protein